jgi:Tfp pilus assembly protein PilN
VKRLAVDFVRRARSPWAARGLLVLAAAMAVDAAVSYLGTQASLEAAEARLARAEPRRAPARELPAAEIAAVRETLDRLALPWGRLFTALESAASADVALLGIEPDPKAGTVLIAGDSKDYRAVLNYVLTLSRTEGLSRVQLVRHQAKSEDPKSPVSFTLSAAWNGAQR